MARRVFFSFHFDNDFWRTQQVRNMGALEGNAPVSANVWEAVKKKGDAAIERWIEENMHGKSCVVVLVGSQTASRPWVIHEIVKGWDDGKGVLAVRIDKLLNKDGKPSTAGTNPLSKIKHGTGTLADVVPIKTPAGFDSKAAYASISSNIETWIEEAIKIRNNS
ncbi:TIR domain-containing protein [Bradyrhizobium xenonodulans]|uniref:TIR domain-containing protein n=1 Tax=Bradyrhizobium xenonodulans TaxID=2736875 RepID=A0ABY7MI90_9BRAD|nr:TIR domain-containing protein [Bradyrhizobium xenonodulans]WBL78143.1 TIR domain-containing protein [Bradyrhizobium xenonodulans]